MPDNVDEFTLTAAFVDERGRIGMDQIKLKVDRSRRSGQALTPAPGGPLTGNENLPNAPEVWMIAPRVPTAVALGAQDSTLNATNGFLFFIHVSAVAQSSAEIAVSETGIRDGFTNPLPVGLRCHPAAACRRSSCVCR